MNIGFDTIGNATIIAYDRTPVLATDPWVQGSAYFGSWRMSHKIPEEQLKAVKEAKYVWFSHGHPDHLNPDSLELFRDQTILLPDHVGQRIKGDLEKDGYSVQILPNREWVSLSEKIKVMCICDYYQDAMILIDINGRLLINTNDAIDRGWGRFARGIANNYRIKFLLALFGHGDADMINFFDDKGIFIEPKAAKKLPVGITMARAAESWRANYVVPFSSMHRYQRSDSVWANEYVTDLADYKVGFDSKTVTLLPAYIRFDCEADIVEQIDPEEEDDVVYGAEHFGDDWNEELSAEESAAASSYFQKIQHLNTFLDFINLKVGGKDNIIPLAGKGFDKGLTFEVPRQSLVNAIDWRVFDDLLIGNFMRTTLHGKWPKSVLYPDFIPFVARYSDNANANSKEELADYFDVYRKRAPVEYFWHRLESRAIDMFRARITGGSKPFELGKKMYWYFKKV